MTCVNNSQILVSLIFCSKSVEKWVAKEIQGMNDLRGVMKKVTQF